MVLGVTQTHKGLAPSRLIPIFIGKDAHAGHTQSLKTSGQEVADMSEFTLNKRCSKLDG